MLCSNCRDLPNEVVLERAHRARSLPGWERLRDVLCDGCGTLVPHGDQTDRLLRRLSHLARFGLAAGASPILRSG
jgi:hypothetical protein